MLISCEKCSTTYVLDDALIPPQGAPVQCTRCGHVFTARATAAEPPAPPPPPPAARPGSSTLMFGAAGTPSAPPAKNQTMMFGTSAANAAGAAAPQAPANARSTMMFGSPSAAPEAKAPPAPPAAKNQTMMFGTPASAAASAAPPAPAAPTAAKTTMMFGGNQVAAPPPAAPPPPAKNQTMMFGTPASNAAPPPAPVPAARTTMMFGANQPQPPPPAAPPPAKNQTMMFGTAASNAAAQAPAPPPPAARQTLVFGGGSAPPPAAPAKNQTMMFGTAASNAAADVPEAPVEETILDQPGQSARTVMFGNPLPSDAPPAAPPPPAKNQTMMFGRAAPIPKVTAGTVELAGYAADESAPNESTVRVDVQQVIGEHTDAQPEDAPRHDRTQRYAMSDVGGGPTPPEGSSPVQDRHNRTQLFAMSVQDSTAPMGNALEEPANNVLVDHGAGSIDLNSTLPAGAVNVMDLQMDQVATLPPDTPVMPLERRRDPEGVSLLHDPANMTPPEAPEAPMLPNALATTLPNLGPINEARPMPPLSLEMPQDAAPHQPRQAPPVLAQDDAAAMRAARSGGAGRIVVIVLALVALALLGVLVYRLFGAQLGLTGALEAPPALRRLS